jgi:hypothetical protein
MTLDLENKDSEETIDEPWRLARTFLGPYTVSTVLLTLSPIGSAHAHTYETLVFEGDSYLESPTYAYLGATHNSKEEAQAYHLHVCYQIRGYST